MTRVRSRALVAVAVSSWPRWRLLGSQWPKCAAYPCTLVDPGTFGGPSTYVVLPGVPITSNGTVLGTADTATPDPDLPGDDFHDGYIQHAFTWRAAD